MLRRRISEMSAHQRACVRRSCNPSHGENRGSSPLESANDFNRLAVNSVYGSPTSPIFLQLTVLQNSILPEQDAQRFDILPRVARSLVEICLGSGPSHAAKSRPLAKPSPLPIAPSALMPGMLISRHASGDLLASSSISPDKPSIRVSNDLKSEASRSRTIRVDSTSGGAVQNAALLARTVAPGARNSALQEERTNLIGGRRCAG
jgi:hypothetical protein